MSEQAEGRTKFGVQRVGRIAHHVESRTLQRPAGAKGGDDDMAAGF